MRDFLWFEENKCKYFQFQLNAYSDGIVDRLLKSFEETEKDVEKERQKLFKNVNFNPDYDDPYDIENAIEEKLIDYHLNIVEVRDMLFGFALTGLYHIWEKQIVGFLKTEIKHVNPSITIENWNNIKKNCQNMVFF